MMKYQKKKGKKIFLSLIYRISNLLPLSTLKKLQIFAQLEWIFYRLSHEQIGKLYSKKNNFMHMNTMKYLKKFR